MYAYYFPFFCFFLHPLQLPCNETRRNGTSSFRLLSISHHLSLELISTPPSLECDVFRRQRGGFNSLPFCFRAFQCKQGGFNPPPPLLFSTTALKNEQTCSFLRAVVVLEHLPWHHQCPPPTKVSYTVRS